MKVKKILILSPYPKDCAPSQRLKYEQYLDHLRDNGYEITIQPFVSEYFWKIIYKKGFFFKKVVYTASGYLKRFFQLFTLKQYDVVYVHLWVTPIGIPLFEFLTISLSKKVIYDIDDMIFLGHSSDANKFIESLKGREKMIYLMKKANHVITCTPTLDEFVRQYNSNTTDISSTINTDLYKSKNDYSISSQITFGWSGSHSTSKYMLLLEPVFEKLLKENINFKVLIIGDADFKYQNSNIPIETLPWKLETEVQDLSRIDIGLYPLPDEKWVLGKSGLKALQYMALGIPTIASKIGANYRIIQTGENGYLVEIGNDEEWVSAIRKLVSEKELREKIGQKAYTSVEEKYSINANKNTYLQIINHLTHDDKAPLSE